MNYQNFRQGTPLQEVVSYRRLLWILAYTVGALIEIIGGFIIWIMW